MTPEQLDDIEARANLATPGPWHYVLPSLKGYPQRVSNDAAVEVAETFDGPEFPPANAEFIAHARADVPALVAEVRRLRAAIDQTYALLDHWHDLGRNDGMHGRELRQVLDSAHGIDKEQTA